MRRRNRTGPALLGPRPEPGTGAAAVLAGQIEDDAVAFIDIRNATVPPTDPVTRAV